MIWDDANFVAAPKIFLEDTEIKLYKSRLTITSILSIGSEISYLYLNWLVMWRLSFTRAQVGGQAQAKARLDQPYATTER